MLEKRADVSRLTIYVNGQIIQVVDSDTRCCVGYDIPMPASIGAIHGIQEWSGAIDELRIYNRPLGPAEVAFLAAPAVGPAP